MSTFYKLTLEITMHADHAREPITDALGETMRSLEGVGVSYWRFIPPTMVNVEPNDAYAQAERISGEGAYIVTQYPDDPSMAPEWVGLAENPVDALNRYAKTHGFAGYDNQESRSEVGLWGDGDGQHIGATAPFTNCEVYSMHVSWLARS